MTQLCLVLTLPRARRADPATSHHAAAQVERFAGGHYRLILNALAQGSATFKEIAARSGLERHAVARRLPELQAALKVRTTDEIRDGCRVWRSLP
jgi:DNA-binding HxlR family transcriptional regulator